MTISRGARLEARTASGASVRMVALGPETQGRDFVVVWVCTEPEWARAEIDGDEPDALPWPVEDLRVLAEA